MRLFSEYKKTEQWQLIVSVAIVGKVCCKCGTRHNLTARHKTYERLGQELASDLEAICELCVDIWPQPEPPDIDPGGWMSYAVIADRDWGGYENEVFEAWRKYRTYGAALRAYRAAKERKRARKYADPENPKNANYFGKN